MRIDAILRTFFPQREPLVDAETMLFIDNHQQQMLKLHLILKHGMRTHDHFDLTATDSFQLSFAGFTFDFAGQPAGFDAERSQPVAEIVGMLFRQQFGRCHQHHLSAMGDHL